MMKAAGFLIFVAVASSGCLGARSIQRNYYILNVDTERKDSDPLLGGHLYVGDLASERIYDKEQLVLRRSPYTLRYSAQQLWAAKPSRMISDLVAQSMDSSRTFEKVSRMLAEGRPTFALGGNLRALEVKVAKNPWEVRIAFDLELVRFDDGELLWRYSFDEKRPVDPEDYDQAVRKASHMLQAALDEAVMQLTSKAQSEAFSRRAFDMDRDPDPRKTPR